MFVRPSILAAAAVTAGLLAIGAVATPAMAQDAPSVTVSYADLNLASPLGREILDRRIAGAASQLCGTARSVELTWAAAVNDCREATIAATQPQRDAAVGLRGTVQVSLNQALRVSRAAN
jgi:UrcA family protein